MYLSTEEQLVPLLVLLPAAILRLTQSIRHTASRVFVKKTQWTTSFSCSDLSAGPHYPYRQTCRPHYPSLQGPCDPAHLCLCNSPHRPLCLAAKAGSHQAPTSPFSCLFCLLPGCCPHQISLYLVLSFNHVSSLTTSLERVLSSVLLKIVMTLPSCCSFSLATFPRNST